MELSIFKLNEHRIFMIIPDHDNASTTTKKGTSQIFMKLNKIQESVSH